MPYTQNMRHHRLFKLVVWLVVAHAAQAQITPFSRPEQVLFDSMGFGYSVASEGELTGALYTDLFPTDKVWLQISDGRAVEWGPRVRINAPGFVQTWIVGFFFCLKCVGLGRRFCVNVCLFLKCGGMDL